MTGALTRACDAAAPRVSAVGRGAVYWWTPQIWELQRLATRVRRKFTHAGRRGDDREVAHEELRVAREALRREIKGAKARA